MCQGFPIVLHGREEPKAGTACSRALTPEGTLIIQKQEWACDAASEAATWAPAPPASPRDVTEKRDHSVRPSAPQSRVCLGRGRERGSSLQLLHQARGGHTTNLLWKLATERSPGHPQAGERKRTRVMLKQRQAALPTDGDQHARPHAACPCQAAVSSVPQPRAAPQEHGLAQSLLHSRGESGM